MDKPPVTIRQDLRWHGRRRWAFAALSVVAVALVAWVTLRKKPVPTPKPQPIAVSVAKVAVQDVPVSIAALGAAQAWTSDTILARVSGTLLSVDFAEGTDVKAGQLLAQIDPAPYIAALNSATASQRCYNWRRVNPLPLSLRRQHTQT